MHDRLIRTDVMDCHVSTLLRAAGSSPRPNRRFGLLGKESSPIRQFARKRFRESLAAMITRAQRAPDYASLPEEQI